MNANQLVDAIVDIIAKFNPSEALTNISSVVAQYEAGESPNDTRGVTVVDAKQAKWTIEGTKLLRNGVDTTGLGSLYCYHDHEVHTLGVDNNWYVWRDQWVREDGDPSIPPYRPLPQATKTAVNLGVFGAWGGIDPFVNRFKRAGRWWECYGAPLGTWYTEQPDSWVRGVPDGQSIMNLITVNDIGGELDLTEQRPGVHHLLWKNKFDCVITGKDVAVGELVAPGHYKFTIVPTTTFEADTFANPTLYLEASNRSGETLDFVEVIENGLRYPALVHDDDMEDFLAGKTYQKTFINGLSGAKVVRNMDWNLCPMEGVDAYGTVTLKTLEPENFSTMSYRTYTSPDNNTMPFCPREMGALAREANVSVFNTMQAKSSDVAFDFWASEFMAGAGPDWKGDVYSELGDENWNVAFPWNIGGTYLREVIAPSILVVDMDGKPSTNALDIVGCASADRALKLWRAMEKHIPRERHKRVLSGQFWYTAAMGGMFAYRDPVTGERAGDLADYYAVAPYWNCLLTDLTLDQILDGKLWETNPAQWWIDRCTQHIDNSVRQTQVNQLFLAQHAPKLKLTMYEGGGYLHEMRMPKAGDARYAAGKAFDKWARDFIDGEPGRVIMDYYWTKLASGNYGLMNWFTHQGYSYSVQVGLHFSQHRPDTPRQAYFRSK